MAWQQRPAVIEPVRPLVYGISTMHQTTTTVPPGSGNVQFTLPEFGQPQTRSFPIAVVSAPHEASKPTAPTATIEELTARAESVLETLLVAGSPLAVAYSAGKDSSLVMNLVLVVAARLASRGVALPPIVVSHSDTLCETPEVSAHAAKEMEKIREYAAKHSLDVTVEVAHPLLTDQWPVRVIGGRGLPTFASSSSRDCSINLKVRPQLKLRKRILKDLKKNNRGMLETVTCLGTRFSESTTRGNNMRDRNESAEMVRRGVDANGKSAGLFLSPIADWTSDDVWEYLGMARAGAIPAYSDFEETFRIYTAGMATSCVIVAEDMVKAMKSSRPCGARTGCYICTAVSVDQSMENMIAADERYHYMRGLNEFRNFLVNTRWDMARRSWLGRTINNGYVRIGADAYSPAMMEELLKYALTIDAVEKSAARRAGVQPRFVMVNIEQLFAIDAMWSLQAFHPPFHALKIYRDIENGARYPVPKVEEFEQPKEMPSRYLYVGADWDHGEKLAYTGLRSAIHELVAMDSAGCMGNKELADGRSVLDINTGTMMQVEVETAYFVLDEELDDLLVKYHDNPKCNPTVAYYHYIGLGLLSVKSGMQGEIDSMLRRSNFKVREGIAGEVDIEKLLARSISAKEAGAGAVPAGQRKKTAKGKGATVAVTAPLDFDGETAGDSDSDMLYASTETDLLEPA